MTDQYGPYSGPVHIDPSTGTYVAGPAPEPAPVFGTPPALTNAAAGIPGQVSSVLQQLLSFSGLDVPATQPAAQFYPAPSLDPSRAFLHGQDPQEMAAAKALGQTVTDSLGDDRVYMGHDDVVSPMHQGTLQGGEELAGQQTGGVKHKSTTVTAALNMPYLWSEDKVAETQKKMREAGFDVGTFDQMMSVWQSLVTRASRAYVLSGGEQLVTPWDMLSAAKKEAIANGTLDKNGNIVHTSTSTSVNTLSEGQAWSTIRATMQQMLGRDPTDQEVRDFLSQANADAARDPSKTVSRTVTNSETGQSHTTSHTTGGYTSDDAARSAYDEIHDSADYGRYQSATTFFNAMVSALGEVAGSA